MAYIVISLLISLSQSAYAADNTKQLNQLQSKIERQASDLKKSNARLNSLSKDIKAIDKSINVTAAKHQKTQAELKRVEKQITILANQKKKLLKSKKIQQQELAKQVEAIYLSGNSDYLKLLLNQEKSSTVERSLVYYEHLVEARTKAIQDLEQTIQEIEQNQNQQRTAKNRLSKLQSAHKKHTKELELQKKKQKKENSKVASIIKSNKQNLTELQLAEVRLKQQITKLAEQKKRTNSQKGLAPYKGKLSWPVKGKILNAYNSRRFNDVRWQGMVISAREGAKVRSISTGKVVFADWLRGFGMVIIVEHGKGYLSLYGHNQTLLKEAGDIVNKGEVISKAGRSGGQLKSSLYFEIRHKGEPVNPRTWLKR